MLDTTKLYSLILVGMTLTSIQGHRIARKNVCSCSLVKWHEFADFCDALMCMGDDCKAQKIGGRGGVDGGGGGGWGM